MGLPSYSKQVFDRIQPNDMCVIYIKGNVGIGGTFEIESLNPTEKIKWIGNSYPYRLKLIPQIIPQNPIPIKPHISALKMLPNKKNWPICLRRAKKIPDEDIDYIQDNLV